MQNLYSQEQTKLQHMTSGMSASGIEDENSILIREVENLKRENESITLQLQRREFDLKNN